MINGALNVGLMNTVNVMNTIQGVYNIKAYFVFYIFSLRLAQPGRNM
jgi:hypothetical protein